MTGKQERANRNGRLVARVGTRAGVNTRARSLRATGTIVILAFAVLGCAGRGAPQSMSDCYEAVTGTYDGTIQVTNLHEWIGGPHRTVILAYRNDSLHVAWGFPASPQPVPNASISTYPACSVRVTFPDPGAPQNRVRLDYAGGSLSGGYEVSTFHHRNAITFWKRGP